MTTPCIACTHHRLIAGGQCVRPMTMYDGKELKAPRSIAYERDEKWRGWTNGLKRSGGDICGKDKRHFEAREIA